MSMKQCVSLGVLLLFVSIGRASQEAHGNQTAEDLRTSDVEQWFDPNLEESLTNGCHCIKKLFDCGCCLRLAIKYIVHDTVCVNITYLPHQYGIALILTLGHKVLINETVSVENPPPICIDVPDLKKLLSFCIDFYDLDVHGKTFRGCVKLEVRAFFVVKANYHIGCFKIGGPSSKKMLGPSYDEKDQQHWLEELAVMQTKKRMQMKALMQTKQKMQMKTLL